jgi:hypothetical protein
MTRDDTPESVPSFLYIGAPRSGSTWLWENLGKHPAVWVPPCKNISYFHPRFQVFRFQRFRHFGREIFVNGDPSVRQWYRRFFTRPIVDDRWYLSLFPSGRVTGEIAESYCSLDRRQIHHLHGMMPSAKIIFVLRNPIDRVLSQAKWGLAKRRSRRVEDVPQDEFLAYIDRPGSRVRSSYSRTLRLWSEFYSDKQFMVLFYEDLISRPNEFLSSVCHFLGVPFRVDYFAETVSTRVQGTTDRPLPPAVVKHAASAYKEEVAKLAARFGGPALEWQRGVEEVLKS